MEDPLRQQYIVNQQRYGNPWGPPAKGWCLMCREDGPSDKYGHASACDNCLDAEMEDGLP